MSENTAETTFNSIPVSKEQKQRSHNYDPKVAYKDLYPPIERYLDSIEAKKMYTAVKKEQCARCKTLGIFQCEHQTPVRDKFRNMQEKHGKLYESPREFEDELDSGIFSEASNTGNLSHNALSYHRQTYKQKRMEDNIKHAQSYDIKKQKRLMQHRFIKTNSLRPNNVNLSRLSFKSPRKQITPRSKKPVNVRNHENLFDVSKSADDNYETQEEVEDLENPKSANNSRNANVKKDASAKKDKKRICTIL